VGFEMFKNVYRKKEGNFMKVSIFGAVSAIGFATMGFFPSIAVAESTSIQGTYKAVLVHEPRELGGITYHQFATITLRTVNTGSSLKISASVRMIFGEWNSNEFLPYEFPDVPMNILTRQLSMRDNGKDVSLIGTLNREGQIKGDWFASSIGRVGTFVASKTETPILPVNSLLVNTVTGQYRGTLVNQNPDSNLPERITMSLVTTQSPVDGEMELKISGNIRFYLGDFGTSEFVETKLSEVQFNYYTRYLTLKTEEYGLTFKGVLDPAGNYMAEVFANGLGSVGKVELKVLK